MEEVPTKKCSKCSRAPQPHTEFRVGEKEFKSCQKCRDKGKKNDMKRREDPEKRDERNAYQREHKYYQAYRNRKREENIEAFREHNNEIHRKWKQENHEHVRDWYKKSLNSRLDANKSSASKRGYDWYLSDDYAKELMTSPCHYCGLLDLGVRVNGIDRVENALGYWPSNAVSCCKLCNYFKKDYTVDEFLTHAKRITEHQKARVTQLV